MWDLPGPGMEPMSPALADGYLTTVPPGKSLLIYFLSLEKVIILPSFKKKFLFIWLRWVLVVARGLSSCGLQALERRLSSCSARA